MRASRIIMSLDILKANEISQAHNNNRIKVSNNSSLDNVMTAIIMSLDILNDDGISRTYNNKRIKDSNNGLDYVMAAIIIH